MNDSGDDYVRAKTRLDAALRTREFEVELFWKRSQFFLTFQGFAFAGFAATVGERPPLVPILIAAFGLVTSAAWAGVARGSKYWYENWERKVTAAEREVVGLALFGHPESTSRPETNALFRGRRVSVSQTTIAVSDATFLIWLIALGWRVLQTDQFPDWTDSERTVGVLSQRLGSPSTPRWQPC